MARTEPRVFSIWLFRVEPLRKEHLGVKAREFPYPEVYPRAKAKTPSHMNSKNKVPNCKLNTSKAEAHNHGSRLSSLIGLLNLEGHDNL